MPRPTPSNEVLQVAKILHRYWRSQSYEATRTIPDFDDHTEGMQDLFIKRAEEYAALGIGLHREKPPRIISTVEELDSEEAFDDFFAIIPTSGGPLRTTQYRDGKQNFWQEPGNEEEYTSTELFQLLKDYGYPQEVYVVESPSATWT